MGPSAYHVKTMRAVRPRGPCFVGGWSAGGAIGYEIGQQLLAQGEDVALVVLFDTRTLAPSPAPAISEIPRPAGEASWGHLIEVHDIPGNDRTMFEKPSEELPGGARLACLDQVSADAASGPGLDALHARARSAEEEHRPPAGTRSVEARPLRGPTRLPRRGG